MTHLDSQKTKTQSIQWRIRYMVDRRLQACKNMLRSAGHNHHPMNLSGCRRMAGTQVPSSGPTDQPTVEHK